MRRTQLDSLTEKTEITEELWRAWKQKGKRRDRENARRFTVLVSIVMGLAAISSAVYFEFLK